MKKYKVTQEFMDELETWQGKLENNQISVNKFLFDEQIRNVESWRLAYRSKAERNQRFGAIINWINGEDVFEIGMPKYIVKRKRNKVLGKLDEYISFNSNGDAFVVKNEQNANRFVTYDKASEWANKHFEVVEVDE